MQRSGPRLFIAVKSGVPDLGMAGSLTKCEYAVPLYIHIMTLFRSNIEHILHYQDADFGPLGAPPHLAGPLWRNTSGVIMQRRLGPSDTQLISPP